MDSSDAKTVIKNIRRHIRLLNTKWLELHNKADRWQTQLTASKSNLETIDNLTNLAARHLSEIDSNLQSWKDVRSLYYNYCCNSCGAISFFISRLRLLVVTQCVVIRVVYDP